VCLVSVVTRDYFHVHARPNVVYQQRDESDDLLCMLLTSDCVLGNASVWRLTKVKVKEC
jgi:hypothetical protein